MFENRTLLIATKHKKEKVIAPVLANGLGVDCFTVDNLDTDSWGTFSGEVERKHDPLTTARAKCLWAMELHDCDLAVASEGSFGPHPSLPFVNADEEFLVFIDKKNDLEIVAREISTDTNFDGREIGSLEELLDFAKTCQFPSHGMILRPSKGANHDLVKGIVSHDDLENSYRQLSQKFKRIYAETDMRAMFNPSRMAVIEKATVILVEKIKSTCPRCETPGFGVVEVKRGLPCSLCGSPTNSTLSHIYHCNRCKAEKEEMYPHEKTTEDPMYCNYCNP